ncbi:hypothetical protein ACULNC_14180 [Shigella flexneri]
MMKKLSNNTACVFTGKGLSFGGNLFARKLPATVWFISQNNVKLRMGFEGMSVSVSAPATSPSTRSKKRWNLVLV